MKGTRVQTMASVLVTLVAPAALAIQSNPLEDKIAKKHSHLEMPASWQIPAPGQTLARVPSTAAIYETTGTLGTVVTVDPVTQTPKSRFGRLPLTLSQVFGGEKSLIRWTLAAEKSEKSKAAFEKQLEMYLRHFANEHQSELGLSGLSLVWDSQKFFVDSQHTFASFQIGVGDSLVEAAELTFRFSDGQLVSVVTKTFNADEVDLASIRVGGHRAAEAARAVLGPNAQLSAASVTKLWIPKAEGRSYTFEPAIRFEAASATGELYTVIAHADRNEILSWNAQNIFIDSRVSGVINQRTPTGPQQSVAFPYVRAQVKLGGWFGRTRTIDADASGMLKLSGQSQATVQLNSARVKVVNSTGRSASVDVKGDAFFDARTNSTLAENTTYFHLLVAQAWARPVVNPKWFSTQLVANVNIGDICNAFWNGRTVNFFQAGSKRLANGKTLGCSNTGENADVVYHEWGHGLHHNTGGIRDRAFSEGIGDTVSQLITGSADVGPGFFTDGRPVRNLDGEYSYPPKPNEREVHKEGLIFGSAYFHLTQALVEKYGSEVGRATARQWFLKTLYTASQYTDVYESLLALDSEPLNEDVRGPNYCIVNTAFARHGLADKDQSCR